MPASTPQNLRVIQQENAALPEVEACATCGEDIDPDEWTYSEEVEQALRVVQRVARHRIDGRFLAKVRHPLCDYCFVGWIHNVLGIDNSGDDDVR